MKLGIIIQKIDLEEPSLLHRQKWQCRLSGIIYNLPQPAMLMEASGVVLFADDVNYFGVCSFLKGC